MNPPLIIFLHGVGSNGQDFQSLANMWQRQLTEIQFAFPNAPHQFDHGPGYQWFSLDGITGANRPTFIKNARAEFDALIYKICQKHHVILGKDRIFFVGFSQGSIMALDVVASQRMPVTGVVAFSGLLGSEEIVAGQTPVLLCHGQQDPVIDFRQSIIAEKALNAAGNHTTLLLDPTAAHMIPPTAAQKAIDFIKELSIA